jgi:hypothetical protein
MKTESDEQQIEKIIYENIKTENVKISLLNFITWLKDKNIIPMRQYYEGQSPFWEIECNGKKLYLVWNEKDKISIMIKIYFSNEYQIIILENNMKDIIVNNLQYCSRKDGDHCNNCDLPPGVAGIDDIIFGKEFKNLCCGQFLSFDNPNEGIIEGIKKLLEL